jgi:hypothetical protein
MAICARTAAGPVGRSGGGALATSGDLEHWTVGPPLLAPGITAELECPVIERAGAEWMLLGCLSEQRSFHAWRAPALQGPWEHIGCPRLRGWDRTPHQHPVSPSAAHGTHPQIPRVHRGVRRAVPAVVDLDYEGVSGPAPACSVSLVADRHADGLSGGRVTAHPRIEHHEPVAYRDVRHRPDGAFVEAPGVPDPERRRQGSQPTRSGERARPWEVSIVAASIGSTGGPCRCSSRQPSAQVKREKSLRHMPGGR